jgi:nucleotide-binding universal stress UspA family protein
MEGFALRWQISDVAGVDMMGAIPMERYTKDIEEEAKKAQQLFESFMQDNNVPRSTETKMSPSFSWLDGAPEGESFVGSYGRVFDVIVMNQPNLNLTPLYHRAIESGLFESGRPILLAPPSQPSQIASNVLIAWNSSTEQARATALAIPLLHKAERVTVLTVIGGAGVPGPSAEQLIQYLQRNGIVAEPMKVELVGRNTGEAILATAKSLGCDLLIKGAYTQSRLRQMFFGGTTQHILENADLPVLLAN